MGYSIYLVRSENKNKQQQSRDPDFFENEDNLEPFSGAQLERLRDRLGRYGFVDRVAEGEYPEFSHPRSGVLALLTGSILCFLAPSNENSIFDACMTASEFTDSGEFAKFDPQAGGWEVI